jgi:hypothetical protein
MHKKIISAFSFTGFIFLIWLAIWAFMGKYEINATVDGEGISTPVRVDGEIKCNTPCNFRLVPGYHTIVVDRPEGFENVTSDTVVEKSNTLYVFSFGRGTNFSPEFTSGR